MNIYMHKLTTENFSLFLYLAYLPLRQLINISTLSALNDSVIEIIGVLFIVVPALKYIGNISIKKILFYISIISLIFLTYVIVPANRYFIISSLPLMFFSLLCILICNEKMRSIDYMNALEIASILLFFYWQITLLTGNFKLEAGGEYSMSFGFSIVLPILFFIYSIKNKKRIYILLTVISFFELLIYGNKSPLVSVVIYILIILLPDMKKNKVFHISLYIIGLIIAICIIKLYRENIFSFIYSVLQKYGYTSRSIRYLLFNRFFDLGLQMNSRSYIYSMSISKVIESPLYGYGFKGDMAVLNGVYPHNIILELSLQFGVVFASIILIIFISSLIYSYKYKREYKDIITIFLVYSLTQLAVSSSVWQVKEFWILINILWFIPNSNNLSKNTDKKFKILVH